MVDIDTETARRWGGRWRAEYERCASAEGKLAAIAALCDREDDGLPEPVAFISDLRAILRGEQA